jgi:hypothetical protein
MKLWPKAQVRPIRFHDLRHTTGSLLLMAGANPAAVQRILRHSDPRITTEVYGHLLPGYLRSEIDKLAFEPKAAPADSKRSQRQHRLRKILLPICCQPTKTARKEAILVRLTSAPK